MEVSLRQGAAISFFILIALQFPFFSLRDEDGKNTIAVSPLEVVVSELRMTKAVPPEVLHALLYPGAAKDSLSAYFFCMKGPGQCSEGGMLPDMEALLELKIIPLDKQLSKQLGKQKMLMIAASFFNLGGGLSAPFYATRLVMFGTLLTFWGCFQAQVMILEYYYATIPVCIEFRV
mmetsp:Transcript_68803/g.217588  ORF Transcript_68803/g.217588 Transcript_68803/m.217588 type:complete len:176 (-) Transcript_68803:118-645(-)